MNNKLSAKANKISSSLPPSSQTSEDRLTIPQFLKRQDDLYNSKHFAKLGKSLISSESFIDNEKDLETIFPKKYTQCTSFDEALEAAVELDIDIIELLDKHTECELIEIINHHLRSTSNTTCCEQKLQELFNVANDLSINTDIVLANAKALGISLNDALESAIFEVQNCMKVSPKGSPGGAMESKNSAQPTPNKINPISCDNDTYNFLSTSISPLQELRKSQLIKELSNQGIDKLTAQAIAEAKFENKNLTTRFNKCEIEEIESTKHIILEEKLNCSGSDWNISDAID